MAQSTAGNFVGRVTDPSGGVIAGVGVRLIRQETGFTRTASTDALGNYEFRIVDPGTYTIEAETKGFKKYTNKDVILLAGQTLRVDAPLEVGSVTEGVTVIAEAPVINTETAQIGETRTPRLLVQGPQGNPIMTRFGLNTGQWSLTVRAGSSPESNYKSMGSRATMWEAAVDGNAIESSQVSPPYDAMAEEKTTVINASAEQRTPVLIDAVTKQGTNRLHGDFTAQLGHPALNALAAGPPGGKRAAQVGRKVFGYAAGGPVYIPKLYDGRNKTFFFIAIERNPTTNANYLLTEYIPAASVPTDAMRQGDFSAYLAKTKPGFQLVDPLSGQPFLGNMIPRSRWNPAGIKAVDGFYPKANISQIGDPNVPFENLVYPYDETGAFSHWFWRVDQKITNKNTAGFHYNAQPNVSSGLHAGWWGLVPTTGHYAQANHTWDYGWQDTHILNPNVVNEFRLGWYRAHNIAGAQQKASTVIDPLGIDLGADKALRESANVIPNFNITGFDKIGGLYNQLDDWRNWWEIRDNVSWKKARHTFKFGYDHRFKHFDANDVSQAIAGQWDFTGRFTGDPFADFVLGLPQDTVRYTPRPQVRGRYNELGFFVQDDFQATSNLTVNLGFRIDRISPRTDGSDAYFNFNPATGALVLPDQKAIGLVNPAFPKSIAIQTASQAGYPSTLTNALFSPTPRVGLAWRPFGKSSRVIRAAYGIFSADAGSQGNNFALLQTGGPFSLSETFVNTVTNGVPLVTLDHPFPAATGNVPASFNIAGVNPFLKTPYMQQWNVSIEQQVGKWALRWSYVGAKTTHIIYKRDINLPQPSLIPFTSGRYIYPGFQSVNWFDSGGNSNYNSGQFQFTHRWGNGLLVDGMFMWNSEIADVADNGGYPSIEDPFSRLRERAKAFLDPLDFRTNFVYRFPFGKGQKFGGGMNRVANAVVGDWEFAGIFDARNGRPDTVFFSGKDPSNTNTFGGRANLVSQDCNTRSGNGLSGPYLNIACYGIPAPGTFGNLSPATFLKPGSWDWSGTLYKNFSLNFIHEGVNLRFGAVAQNIMNHPTWNTVGNNLSVPASFGKLSGQGAFGRRSGARSIILQGRIEF